jgi:hypothetical protein
MATRLLPDQFEDLEPYVSKWALATGPERGRARLSSTMEEIQVFCDATFPRMDAIIEYLDQFPLEALPEEVRPLLYLTLSLAEVSRPVELFGRPGAKGLDETRFELIREPELPRL